MAVTSGPLRSIKVDGVNFDPRGDFTISESRFMKEHVESTIQGNHYYSEKYEPGKVEGAIAIRPQLDTSSLTEANEAEVIIEIPGGDVYSGTMTYIDAADISVNEGTLAVNLSGELTRL